MTGNADNSILFAGYQYDKETGLYYLNARMYDPITARFMQEDTYLGRQNDPLSLNLYTYCHNSPLMYWDPTGHSAEATFGGQKLGANSANDNMAQREMRKVLNKWNPIASSVGDAAKKAAAGSSNNGYSYSKRFETLSVTDRMTIAEGVKESAAKALHTMSCRSYNNLWTNEDYLAAHIASLEAAEALEWAPPKLVDLSILYCDPERQDRFVQFAKGFLQGLKDAGDGAGDVFRACLVIYVVDEAYMDGIITFEERAQIVDPLYDILQNTGAGFLSGAVDNAIKINTPIGAINTLGAFVYLDTGNTAILDTVGDPFQQKDAYLIDEYDLNDEQYYNGKAGADTYVMVTGLAVSLYSSVSARMATTSTPKVYNANGDPTLRAIRRPIFDSWVDDGIEVNGQTFKMNQHAENSLFKSGRKDIMPADIIDALVTEPQPANPGSVMYVNPSTGTKVYVNPITQEIVGAQPIKFIDKG